MASTAVLDPSSLSPVTLGAIVVTGVLIVAQLAYAWYGSQYRRTMTMMARLPQPRGVPILGHALEVRPRASLKASAPRADRSVAGRATDAQLGLLDDTGRLALLRTWIPKFPHLLAYVQPFPPRPSRPAPSTKPAVHRMLQGLAGPARERRGVHAARHRRSTCRLCIPPCVLSPA